jgi:hypothetical protein
MLHCLGMTFLPFAADGIGRAAERTVYTRIPDDFVVAAARVGLAELVHIALPALEAGSPACAASIGGALSE